MKRFTLFVGTIATVFLLNVSLGQAQQSEHKKHHPNQKKVESQSKQKSGGMMGEGKMQGMTKNGEMCSMMQEKKGGMMGGKMKSGMMKGMMQGDKKCSMMQGKHSGMMSGMMKGNMMKSNMMKSGIMEMMGNMGPLHKYQHTIHHLTQQAENLALTDIQLDKLKNLQANFQKRQADLQADSKKKQIDLGLLLDKKASTSDVRKNLKGVYDNRLDGEIAVYETAQKMLTVLTPEQKEKWEQEGAKDTCNMMGQHRQKNGEE